MRLNLVRERQTQQGTTGHLFLVALDAGSADSQDAEIATNVGPESAASAANETAPFCVTLERPAARFGDSHPCVPAGEYQVVLYESPHFGRTMPLLKNVPDRKGIEIHWGNFVHDFEGCIGVGAWRGQMPDGSPTIWNSRATFEKLFLAIEAAFAGARAGEAEVCTMIILDPQQPIPFASLPRETPLKGT